MTTIAQPGAYDAPGTDQATPSRHASLIEAIASLRPGRGGRFPIESFLLTVGAFLLPIGVVTILLGWWGASHTGHTYEQTDYLISGGLLGLGLIFIGGFLYFGYWMTRQIRVTEEGNELTRQAFARLEAQMAADRRAAPAGAIAVTSAATSPEATGALVATEHGTMLHRPDCPIVAGKEHLRAVEPDAAGYQPCGVCRPSDKD
jgi:hypothetical protein